MVPVSAQQLSGIIQKCVFNTPDNEPYIETYISAYAASLNFKAENDEFNAGVEVTIIIKDGDKIVNFDKVDILSQVKDTSNLDFYLLAQRRISIPPGVYAFEVTMEDINNTENNLSFGTEALDVDFENEISLSEIKLIESAEKATDQSVFVRGEYELIPYMMPYYPTSLEKLQFYVEVYGLDETYLNEDILISYFISQPGYAKPVSGMHNFTKIKGQEVNSILGSLDITNLPSHEYRLHVEIRNRQNSLLANIKKKFYRTNRAAIDDLNNMSLLDINNTFVSEYNKKNLDLYLRSLKPIAGENEIQAINTVLGQEDSVLMQQYLYNFWISKDILNPERSWKAYLAMVIYTLENFETLNRKGFATERGRIYLQYGPPNELFKSGFESSSKPHEIWQYNSIPNGETNVMFVFVNSDFISNDYKLVHSDATGELKNERWQVDIYDRFKIDDTKDLENNDTREHFGTKISDRFIDK